MNILYLAWAGYDLIGASSITGFSGKPELYGEELGQLNISLNSSSVLSGPNIGAMQQDKPTITSKNRYTQSPTVVGKSLDDLRPFPKPKGI